MSGSEPEAKAGVSPVPRRRRRGCLTAVLMLAVFVLGAVCGAGGAVYLVLKRVREEAQHPELRVARVHRWLVRRLDLDEEQARKVRAILEEQRAEMAVVRRSVMPQVARRLRRTDEHVREVLTPAQREKWGAIVAGLRRDWAPADLQEEMGPRP